MSDTYKDRKDRAAVILSGLLSNTDFSPENTTQQEGHRTYLVREAARLELLLRETIEPSVKKPLDGEIT